MLQPTCYLNTLNVGMYLNFSAFNKCLQMTFPRTVNKLNEDFLEINFSCSNVIIQPLYCPKSDVEIGYIEVSLYRQQKHGFYR